MTDGRDNTAAHCDGHLVHFYESAAEFDETVTSHLREALTRGAAVLVIATPEHRRHFEEQLSADGLDLEHARLEQRWIALDAEATLQMLAVGERIDDAAFEEVIGSAVRAAGAAGRDVCAYGEMVELLWRAGLLTTALKLEELWNQLCRELGFSLLCAYHRGTVEGHAGTPELQQVFEQHAGALHHFSADRDAPAKARRFVKEVLRGAGHDCSVVEDAQLVVSELAANAVIHARSRFAVTARADGAGVCVAVRDGSPVAPQPQDPDPLRSWGRGLQLVSTLARGWGVELSADRKTVWAQL